MPPTLRRPGGAVNGSPNPTTNLTGAKQRQICAAGLRVCAERADLNDNVRSRKNIGASCNSGASVEEMLIRKTSFGSGILLDEDRHSSLFNASHARGVRATRRSPRKVSRGIPSVTGKGTSAQDLILVLPNLSNGCRMTWSWNRQTFATRTTSTKSWIASGPALRIRMFRNTFG